MSEAIKIAAFHVENVKRVKAVAYEPTATGLTVIGGKNGQGKTSILDALTWALGGGRMAPSQPGREGSVSPPEIDVTLSNGVRVQRKGKNSSLTVTDEGGGRAGQALLDAFVSEFAVCLPAFLNANGREKANILLKILGIGEELAKLDVEEKRLYDTRHVFGQEVDRKARYAEELPEFPDAPKEPVSVSELLARNKAILAKNAENQRLRNNSEKCATDLRHAEQRVIELERQLESAKMVFVSAQLAYSTASKSAQSLQDESTAEIEADLTRIEEINQHVTANAEKARAADDAEVGKQRYAGMTEELNKVRSARLALLEGAALPLPGLTVQDGTLLFDGKAWDCMSGSEQLRVATAIVRKLKPQCGFVFVDKLEAFDLDTLKEFGEWCNEEGLQVIGTRVSTGDECSIVIEDGLPKGKTYADVAFPVAPAVPATGAAMEW